MQLEGKIHKQDDLERMTSSLAPFPHPSLRFHDLKSDDNSAHIHI
jgi:hypothetical protein